ncbi:UPF0254 family protein [Methanocaldococcus fervens]|uniref:UPF0254 protein Mefer_0370 n=1 Tax=Methanocaldococcus fervens (strain DSM 4213 / JCM 15782 / AG86) TaxID=573064 RepID=C7P6M2_METFA|nr:UPF0254 family protein [Methanocaldococcus fervens]ACV24204.1 Protein of unknown function UPF0254 [Methanocaldococcus fervens AG86]
MITVATAECFTHANIGLTIHKAAAGYEDFEFKYLFSDEDLKLVKNVKIITAMFIPSIIGAEKLLDIKLPEPDYSYKYAKAYSEEKDLIVAKLMAEVLKKKLNVNIAIGSTAGVGRGAICIITDKNCHLFTSDVYANLITFENVKERQKNGIEIGIKKFLEILKEEYFI